MLRQWGTIGFDTTDLGRAWLRAGDTALREPGPVTLPVATRTHFAAPERPAAVAYAFTLPAGRILDVAVDARLTRGRAFVELYRRGSPADTSLTFLRALRLGADTLDLDVSRAHELVVRVEAEPLALGNVVVRLASAPLLGVFPVDGATERDIGSKWGAPRDGGRRRHEGIDVFEARGTPLLASASGRVVRVREGGLGGKTVWLRLRDAPLSLYYAHLDSQLVTPGTRLRPGDTLGTVGNTGNARTTPPHLHFGVYGRGGAIDPLPFVAAAATPEPAPSLGIPLRGGVRLARGVGRGALRLEAKQYVRPLAVADARTLVEAADGRRLWLGRARLEAPATALRRVVVREEAELWAGPDAAAATAVLAPGDRLAVLAEGAGARQLVRTKSGVVGWW